MKFLLWNLENFFLVPHVKSSYNQPLKPQKKVNMIVDIIKDLDPDVLFLCEVGGEDSLIKLKQLLPHQYKHYYTEGNSDRGIGLGFLVKESFAPSRFITHTDEILPAISIEDRKNPRKFSRDAAELWLCDENNNPRLIIWGVHLKSGQDRTGGDWRGIRQRSAEVRGLVKLTQQRQAQFPGINQWIGGDFNGKIYGPDADQEFEHLLVKLPNHSDLLERLDIPLSQRWSFALPGSSESTPTQLDYLFLPTTTATPEPQLSGMVQLWQKTGTSAGWAKNSAEKDLWPSDHLPLLASWDKLPF